MDANRHFVSWIGTGKNFGLRIPGEAHIKRENSSENEETISWNDDAFTVMLKECGVTLNILDE